MKYYSLIFLFAISSITLFAQKTAGNENEELKKSILLDEELGKITKIKSENIEMLILKKGGMKTGDLVYAANGNEIITIKITWTSFTISKGVISAGKASKLLIGLIVYGKKKEKIIEQNQPVKQLQEEDDIDWNNSIGEVTGFEKYNPANPNQIKEDRLSFKLHAKFPIAHDDLLYGKKSDTVFVLRVMFVFGMYGTATGKTELPVGTSLFVKKKLLNKIKTLPKEYPYFFGVSSYYFSKIEKYSTDSGMSNILFTGVQYGKFFGPHFGLYGNAMYGTMQNKNGVSTNEFRVPKMGLFIGLITLNVAMFKALLGISDFYMPYMEWISNGIQFRHPLLHWFDIDFFLGGSGLISNSLVDFEAGSSITFRPTRRIDLALKVFYSTVGEHNAFIACGLSATYLVGGDDGF